MTLREAEVRLSELNCEITGLLKERESVLREWSAAFQTESPQNMICVDEGAGDCHELYLVSGDLKEQVCVFDSHDMRGGIDDFYKRIDTSIDILNIANGRNCEMPEYQRNLIYAKAAEIRERMLMAEKTVV